MKLASRALMENIFFIALIAVQIPIYLFSEEVHSDLLRILKLLKSSGARFDVVRPDSAWTVKDFFNKGATKTLLEEITAWNGD